MPTAAKTIVAPITTPTTRPAMAPGGRPLGVGIGNGGFDPLVGVTAAVEVELVGEGAETVPLMGGEGDGGEAVPLVEGDRGGDVAGVGTAGGDEDIAGENHVEILFVHEDEDFVYCLMIDSYTLCPC